MLAVSIVITAALSWLCFEVNRNNDTRLLDLQVRQTGTVLQAVVPTIQTPLASAVEIAASTGGDVAQFRTYMATYVGASGQFVSASLWRSAPGVPQLIATTGSAPQLSANSARSAAFLAQAARTAKLSVTGPIAGNPYRLGYAYASAGRGPRYVVYAESALPPGRRAKIEAGSPFSNLRFALYLGRHQRDDALLETNVSRLPVQGDTATVVVPFGAGSLTLVAASSVRLGGTLSARLWWVVALVGAALSVAAAFTSERLVSRRKAAERLTGEVGTLLSEQRNLAETLQHAMLPKELPEIEAVEFAARYIPGVNGVEIGGDWYDVVPLDANRFFFVVGDVSGRGVAAGTVMASLLFAIRAFVTEGHSPARVLGALSQVLRLDRDGHFATVMCGSVDVERREVTIANAGHLPLLLVSPERVEFLASPVGPPIGITTPTVYESVTVPLPRDATLLAYTDGLVERRGETIDDGLRRLHDAAVDAHDSGRPMVSTVVSSLGAEDGEDDTAILGWRWLT